jgi:hypothetical protein
MFFSCYLGNLDFMCLYSIKRYIHLYSIELEVSLTQRSSSEHTRGPSTTYWLHLVLSNIRQQ